MKTVMMGFYVNDGDMYFFIGGFKTIFLMPPFFKNIFNLRFRYLVEAYWILKSMALLSARKRFNFLYMYPLPYYIGLSIYF